MENNMPYCKSGHMFPNYPSQGNSAQLSKNKFVYVKQDKNSVNTTTKVFMNPNFKSKVFVNPNFNGSLSNTTIYINPHIQQQQSVNVIQQLPKPNVHINPNFQKIHVNPRVLQNIPCASYKSEINPVKIREINTQNLNRTILSTANKLIRVPVNSVNVEKKRRRTSIRSKYKIVRTNSNTNVTKTKTKYKIDNRKSENVAQNRKNRFVYTSKFTSAKNIVKEKILKRNYVNINGVIYKKSPNSLKRSTSFTSAAPKHKTILRSKYKIIAKPMKSVEKFKLNRSAIVKRYKIVRSSGSKKKVVKVLKKSNIPCPYYRKFGKCKGNDKGICFRKHDPDQIALCTKFLQGACVDEKCLLSHNVSPEKMPTCKYYLEGSCSRENCPYIHVKISAKADICREFLEGFCKKAAECDKRHQLLCPDFEKSGKCLKQRCPYPHGKMVRKYLVNKEKFTKKCSAKSDQNSKKIENKDASVQENVRYYADDKSDKNETNTTEQKLCEEYVDFRCRPKLGALPSFIPFDKET